MTAIHPSCTLWTRSRGMYRQSSSHDRPVSLHVPLSIIDQNRSTRQPSRCVRSRSMLAGLSRLGGNKDLRSTLENPLKALKNNAGSLQEGRLRQRKSKLRFRDLVLPPPPPCGLASVHAGLCLETNMLTITSCMTFPRRPSKPQENADANRTVQRSAIRP